MKHKILFVDDEVNVLKVLKRIFTETDYQVFIESDCQKAIDLIKENRFSVLVSDMIMPEMNGVKLISEANKIDPTCVKLILSGYSDIDDIMKAINQGHIYSYITKPWNVSELMHVIKNACRFYESMANEKILIKKLKNNQDELVALNKNLEKIVEDRTWEIRETNKLLNSIISGIEEDEFLQKTVDILSKAAGGGNAAIWSSKSDNTCFSNKLFLFDSAAIDKVKQSKKSIISNNVLFIPLLKKDLLMGAAIVEKTGEEYSILLQRLESVLSAAKLYLSNQILIEDSASVLSSIDSIIGEIDNA